MQSCGCEFGPRAGCQRRRAEGVENRAGGNRRAEMPIGRHSAIHGEISARAAHDWQALCKFIEGNSRRISAGKGDSGNGGAVISGGENCVDHRPARGIGDESEDRVDVIEAGDVGISGEENLATVGVWAAVRHR